ncbi:hypothetical protein [Gloeobacter morelensis]|uniref:Glycosyl transferase n=1 Tax=Gloeobacter morelensis MG652769 TaxID=2781736 RepID=A0ABY3PQG8_9CYAN|nr:hypothetical protein [Gloeobacter morelensis]UFP95936.1 glycosyl transferase [Gloeobacter morelensis MG652769]
MPLKLCLYSSAHGFGHTTRLLAVASRLRAIEPQARIVLHSHVPDWLVAVHMDAGLERRGTLLDVGLVQSDSFTTDREATLDRIRALQARSEALVRAEREWLAQENFDIVLADIPPLAGRLADAKRPVWGMSNFGWDFIYRHIEDERFAPLAAWSAQLYRGYSGLFRLPFAEAMAAFAAVEPVPLVVNEARFGRDHVRHRLGIAPDRPTALLTFGGLGMTAFPAERVAEHPDWQFVVTAAAPPAPNLTMVEPGAWRLIELLTAVDLAIIKPGYSTVAECCALGLPVVCLTRPGFAEADLLIDGMSRLLDCRVLTTEAFLAQRWDFLDGSLACRPPVLAQGAQRVAECLLAVVR